MGSVKDPRAKGRQFFSGRGISPPSIAAMPMPGIPSVEELVESGEFENILIASFARALRVAMADHRIRATARYGTGHPGDPN